MEETINMADEQQVFKYLHTVRDSGVINMFGEPAYVAEHFDIPMKEATDLFWKWTETFKD